MAEIVKVSYAALFNVMILRKNILRFLFLIYSLKNHKSANVSVINEMDNPLKSKIDHIACPWLIKNFVDSKAEFIYAPADTVKQGQKN